MEIKYHEVDAIIRRRDHVLKHVPRCVACQDEQVQLINITPPVIWKCRICKYTFVCEPPPENRP